MSTEMKPASPGVTRCPCRRAVPLDYTTRDRRQAEIVMRFIDQLGEFMNVNVGGRWYRVSRHCIALHGVYADEIESYGFETARV